MLARLVVLVPLSFFALPFGSLPAAQLVQRASAQANMLDDAGVLSSTTTSALGTSGIGILKTVLLGGDTFGLALREGSLWTIDYGSGPERVIELDPCTGLELSSFPLTSPGANAGLGWDSLRRNFIVTNATSDVIERYDENGVFVTRFPAPYPGPVGAAYDSNRDAYWITDWEAGRLYLIAPDGGPVLLEYVVGGSSLRLAGTAYDPRDDLLLFHGRALNQTYLMRAADGEVQRLDLTPGGVGGDNGTGATFVPGLRTGFINRLSDRLAFEIDLDLPVVFDMETDDSFVNALVNGQEIAPGEEFGNMLDVAGTSFSGLSAAIFDSSPTGPNAGSGDPDLLVDLGGVLILQGNPLQSVAGFYDVPDDERFGGTFELGFLQPMAPLSLDLIDICPDPGQEVRVILTDQQGITRQFDVPSGWTEDVSVDGGLGYRSLDLTSLDPQPGFLATATVVQSAPTFAETEVVSMRVEMQGSGAIDNLLVDPHPDVTANRPIAPFGSLGAPALQVPGNEPPPTPAGRLPRSMRGPASR